MQSKRLEGEGPIRFFLRQALMASAAGMTAEVLTIPLDTAKVRMQIQKTAAGEKPKYSGLFGTLGVMAKEEGMMSWFNGLSPGLQRQFINSGLRVGLYIPVRNKICGEMKPGQQPTLIQKIMAGAATGGIAISFANPTDVVKIRLQAQGRLPPAERPYSGSIDAYKKIMAKDGITGFWVGWGPNVLRNAVINAAELASYDQFK